MHHNFNFHQDFSPFSKSSSLFTPLYNIHWSLAALKNTALHWRTEPMNFLYLKARPSCLWLRTGTSSSWRWRRQPHCRNRPNPNLLSCQEVFNCLGWTLYCGGRGLTIYSVHHRNVQPVFELSPGEDHEKVRNI